MKKEDYIMITITVVSEAEGEKIGRALIDNKLAACVNIIPGIRSLYRWKGEFCDEREFLLLVKSKKYLFEEIMHVVKSLHSYEVPEIIAFSIMDGLPEYLKWVDDTIKVKVERRGV